MSTLRCEHELPRASLLTGRDAVLAEVQAAWEDVGCPVLALRGIGGAGKSAIAAEFVQRRLTSHGLVWSFYENADEDAFMRALFELLSGREASAAGLGLVHAVLMRLRLAHRFLLVLDGLERVQADDGKVEHFGLQMLLEAIAEGFDSNDPAASAGATFLLTTSRFPLDLRGHRVHEVEVGPLSTPHAVDLLQRLGVTGSDEELSALAAACAHHPLTLTLAARGIAAYMDGQAAQYPHLEPTSDSERALLHVARLHRTHLPAGILQLLASICLLRDAVESRMVRDALADVVDVPVEEALAALVTVGLLHEPSPDTYTVHAAVRDLFGVDALEPQRVHVVVAGYLEKRPGAMKRDLQRMEEAIHHYVAAGCVANAFDLYWKHLGASSQLALERGEFACGERIVRRLLEGLPEEKRGTRARLLNELGIFLDQQGRLEEAARCYLHALRHRLRDRSGLDALNALNILHNLCDNAILRGRLPFAEKLAARAFALLSSHVAISLDRVRYEDLASQAAALRGLSVKFAPDEGSSTIGDAIAEARSAAERGLRSRVAALRYGTVDNLDRWKEAVGMGTECLWLCNVLLIVGDYEACSQLAIRNYKRTQDESAPISREAALQATIAEFWTLVGRLPTISAPTCDVPEPRPGVPTLRRDVSEVALEISGCAPLTACLHWARDRGDMPLLCRALTFLGTVQRLAGDFERAAASVAEAEQHARRHGLMLHLAEARLAASHVVEARATALFGDNVSAADLSDAVEAAREALRIASDPKIDARPLAHRAQERLDLLAGWPQVAALRQPPRLDAWTVLASTHGDVLCLAVEAAFAQALGAVDGNANRALALWSECYRLHQTHAAEVVPCYQLAILLAISGHPAQASLVADDLDRRGHPCLGAALGALVREPTTAAQALDDALRSARSDLASSVAAYNLGVLRLRLGCHADALKAFERSRHLDLIFTPARDALRLELDEEPRSRCEHRMRQTLDALEARKRAGAGDYPAALQQLVPRWLSCVPTCPSDDSPIRYVRSANGGRCLLACRGSHRLRLDSSLGTLGPHAAPPPSPLQPLRAIPQGVLPTLHLCPTTHRLERIIE